MLDYSIANIDQNTGHYCTVYATLSENEEVGTETICGGKSPRVSHVIKTLTNQVTVRFVSVDEKEKQPIFLFSVQGKIRYKSRKYKLMVKNMGLQSKSFMYKRPYCPLR